jgi:hypothetical protein
MAQMTASLRIESRQISRAKAGFSSNARRFHYG